ncbi:MAG: ScyD/ScyE family protein [Gemmatimonadota bacterium]|nr:ScyD/ScyE family protein [Gemmatimonadota bacterium]
MPSRTISPLVRLSLFLAAAACAPDRVTAPASVAPSIPAQSTAAARAATVTVFATGFQYPRGLTFAPNGDLYVAEAGSGGSHSTTAAQCAQVVPPTGPYTNGPTSRISRVDRHGNVSIVATGFPSGQNGFGDVLGVADVAFVGNELYALVSGGGCSHGSPNVPAGIARVSTSGSWTMVADLSAWQAANPVANPEPDDFEPDGSWYSLLSAGNKLLAVEPNHGEIVKIDPKSGVVSRVIDISASQGHIVPTVIAKREGALYIGNLGTFPVIPGSEKILRLSRSGELSLFAGGFTTILGIDFDRKGQLYVLESTTAPGFPTPGTGRVVRVDRHGNRTVIADGLFLPTALKVGPDGALYVSNKGFGPPQPGEILRITLPGAD